MAQNYCHRAKKAISEKSSELPETTFFLPTKENLSSTAENCFAPQNEPHSYSKLYRCFEAFSPEIEKKTLNSFPKETISESS